MKIRRLRRFAVRDCPHPSASICEICGPCDPGPGMKIHRLRRFPLRDYPIHLRQSAKSAKSADHAIQGAQNEDPQIAQIFSERLPPSICVNLRNLRTMRCRTRNEGAQMTQIITARPASQICVNLRHLWIISPAAGSDRHRPPALRSGRPGSAAGRRRRSWRRCRCTGRAAPAAGSGPRRRSVRSGGRAGRGCN